MIISRTPFRVSFVGGGSDLKTYYSNNLYGAVVSTAIQKYMYIVIHPYFHNKIRLKYSLTEDVNNIDEIRHPIIRECLRKVHIDSGVEITSFADIPSGTGLGSSSSFTVGLLNALYTFKGIEKTNKQLAQEACEIELDRLKGPGGKQDQYATAIGNINLIKFYENESVDILPLNLNESVIKNFESSLQLYYMGNSRKANSILRDQKKNMSDKDKVETMKKMVGLSEPFRDSLKNNNFELAGKLLNENWVYKTQMADKISNNYIDKLYSKALKFGAIGAKLLGAGGTGFLLVLAYDHHLIEKNMDCRFLKVNIDQVGSTIIYQD
ncbi:uncharacterized protein METZ01_LOCUS290391 [marine metagenome]|uniref:GHMP kinase N-terminal domain-containing protein n=1 Tax=marine metagenome TaxID=408172 RepID=A0A382LQI4_9ZZZZ